MRRGAVLAGAAVLLLAGGTGAGGAQQLRVGLVLQTTDVSRSGVFEHGAFVGFQRAVKELGVQGKVVTTSPTENSFVPGFSYLARQKYDLIIGIGFLQVADLDTAALKFPSSKFAILDARREDLKHRPKNVRGTLFKTEQAAYLAGYLAARLEQRRPGADVVSTIGGYPLPTVTAYIAGFQAGARKADPGITTLNAYSNDFDALAKCRTLALGQIARGSGAVFAVAGACGLGALAAAKEKGAWGIGVDLDQSYLGPFILTSVVKRLDVAAFDLIRSLEQGTFTTGEDSIFDLRNGGVGLGRISPKVSRSLLSQVDRVRKQIVAGKIKVPATLGR
jgi:basic membrane protein A and related proteins